MSRLIWNSWSATLRRISRGDVTVGDHRHLIFASDQQLQHLASAKTWYIDGTFKIVSKTFVQLLSIHFFARSGDDMKQLPGIYVLMPRKRKDYKQVFARIFELMPSPPVTELLVGDFEEGMWRAAKSVLRGVRIHGCAFHWGQAVWRHVQELGLQMDYSQRYGVFKFVRKLLALPFLPEEQIPVAFNTLKETVTSERLIQLTNYIERTWINVDIWTPSSWTVYRMAVRTNNDVEGWHHRINRRAQKSSLSFYVLVILLFKETASIPNQLKMISEGKLRRYQRKTTRLLQCHIN
ncbi:hypothetical protein KUTeg_011603 [Tegillarca granosa]|uniref:MULE transposase domain-containing protein n=1 Tax=Tegillarca granosa TaxID=220873 RepID=A0ABQ9EX66_TEGGR|nr:hypothetical protein KUTeg_011603 [Tegillarca granosa]